MNIRNNVEQRIRDFLKMVSTPPQFTLKGSVQPVIDIMKVSSIRKSVSLLNTAGNADITITSDENESITIEEFGLHLLADGNAANRYIEMILYNRAGSIVWYAIVETAVTASTHGFLVISQLGDSQEGHLQWKTTNNSPTAWGKLNGKLVIRNGEYITINIAGGLAGDDYDIEYLAMIDTISKEV